MLAWLWLRREREGEGERGREGGREKATEQRQRRDSCNTRGGFRDKTKPLQSLPT